MKLIYKFCIAATTILCLLLPLYFTVACEEWEPYGHQEAMNDAFKDYIGGDIYSEHSWGFDGGIRQTRTANVNGNLWYQDWERPVNITDEEREKVIRAFADPIYTENKIELNFSDFWVQQVAMSHTVLTDSAGNSFDASECMNHLQVWKDRYTGEHVNNFNNGANMTVYTDDVTHEQFIGTTLMNNSFTWSFSYHNTKDSRDHFEYQVLEIDGEYYVGFDFWAYRQHPANDNEGVARDYIYNDWIVKVKPAAPAPAKQYAGARRIIVEDLVAQDFTHYSESDFDYNDAVFDVVIRNFNPWWDNGAHNEAVITVYAAGGTMPIYVGGRELHTAFGVLPFMQVDTKTMSDFKPVTFKLTGSAVKSWNIYDIEVRIDNGGNVYELEAFKGEAPSKICVGTDFDWCIEREHIKTKYPKFIDWARWNEYDNDQWYK